MRNGFGKFLQVARILERNDARYGNGQPKIEYLLTKVGRCSEAVNEGWKGPLPHFILKDGKSVILCITRVNDHRKLQLSRDIDVKAKQVLLRLAVGMIIVIVETGFTDADDLPTLRRSQKVSPFEL